MENSADALKMAFAIFIFIGAFTIVFMMISQAKDAADTVFFYSDQTNWYEWKEIPEENIKVSRATVISSLYSFYDENLDITINIGNNKYRFNSNTYYDNETKTVYNNRKDAMKNVNNFINDSSTGLKGNEFTVSCKEIKTTGIYKYGTDGTEIVKAQGGTKLYITYTKASVR